MRLRLVGLVAAACLLPGCGAGGSGESVGEATLDRTAVDPAVDADRISVVDLPASRALAVELTDLHTVAVQRRDRDGAWSAPLTIASLDDRECGEVSAVASGRGVAVKVSCDTSWNEEDPPGDSVALVSDDVTRDRISWDRAAIDGETFTRGPGISPDGRHAVWTDRGERRVLVWSAQDGFAHEPLDLDTDNGSSAATIDDRGRVTGLVVDGIDESGEPGRCTVRIVGAVEQQLDVRGPVDGCPDTSLQMTGGSTADLVVGDPSGTFALALTDGRWRVERVAPAYAPGLTHVDGSHGEVRTRLSLMTDGTWVAVSGADRQHIRAQRFPPGADRWNDPVLAYDHGFPGCTSGAETDDDPYRARAVIGVPLACYRTEHPDGRYRAQDAEFMPLPSDGAILLVTTDGREWDAVRLGVQSAAVSADGRWLATPGRPARLFTAAGRRDLPGDGTGRCDLLVPGGRGTLLGFVGGTSADRFYPRHLRSLDVTALAAGNDVTWQDEGDIDVDLPRDPCTRASGVQNQDGTVSGQFDHGTGPDLSWLVLTTTRRSDGSWAPVATE